MLVAWGALLWAGGTLIVTRAFHLPRRERLIAGLAAGLLIENLLAGLLVWALSAAAAFWLAAGITLLLGVGLWWPFKPIKWYEWRPTGTEIGLAAVLAAGLGLFTLMGRGTSPVRDGASLPIISLLAAGERPLAQINLFNGGIFNEILSAQLVRLGWFYPWLALDLSRALSLSLAAVLAGLWARRVTGSAMAGWCAGVLGWLAGGTRWLLLLFPMGVLNWLGTDAQLLRVSGNWLGTVANRSGGLDMPFLLASDLPTAQFIEGLTGATLLAGLLLLTASRWRGWRAGLITVLLLAGAGLSAPTHLVVVLAGLLTAGAAAWRTKRLDAFSRNRWLAWMGAGLAAWVLILLIFGGTGGLEWRWPPRVSSADWGGLSIFNLRHIFIIFIESGWLILLALPGLAWCWRAFRARRWYEASFLGLPIMAAAGLLMSGPRWITDLQMAVSSFAFSAIGVTAAWLWARKHGNTAKSALAAAWLAAVLGGGVSLGAALVVIPKPILASFIEPLDVQAMDEHWNNLAQGARVFDPLPARGATVFARTSGLSDESQLRLQKSPGLQDLLAENIDYIYFGWADWQSNEKGYYQIQESDCARVISEYTAKRGEDYRLLVDLRGCR
jgi:hypothetical protein